MEEEEFNFMDHGECRISDSDIEELNQDKMWKLYEVALNDLKWSLENTQFQFEIEHVLIKESDSSINCRGCLLGSVLVRRFNPSMGYYATIPDVLYDRSYDLVSKLDALAFDLAFGNVESAYKTFYSDFKNKPSLPSREFSFPEEANWSGEAYLEYGAKLLAYLKEQDI